MGDGTGRVWYDKSIVKDQSMDYVGKSGCHLRALPTTLTPL